MHQGRADMIPVLAAAFGGLLDWDRLSDAQLQQISLSREPQLNGKTPGVRRPVRVALPFDADAAFRLLLGSGANANADALRRHDARGLTPDHVIGLTAHRSLTPELRRIAQDWFAYRIR